MVGSPKKSLALDTNILLDLAAKKDFAHEFKEEFSSRGYSLLVLPTVIAELSFFGSRKGLPQQELALIALDNFSIWNCHPLALSEMDLTVSVRFAAQLINHH